MKRKIKAQILFEKYHKANCGRNRENYEIVKEDLVDYLIKIAYQGKLYQKDLNGNFRPIKNLSMEDNGNVEINTY